MKCANGVKVGSIVEFDHCEFRVIEIINNDGKDCAIIAPLINMRKVEIEKLENLVKTNDGK